MRLAAVMLESSNKLLSACAVHKADIDEWAWAAQLKGEEVNTGVTYGDCPVGKKPHIPFEEEDQ